MKTLQVIPRRPLDDNYPEGYMESDIDWIKSNDTLCLALLAYYSQHPIPSEIKEVLCH